MDYVIDIQGFRDARRKFFPKEVAVVALQKDIVGHWIVQAPCYFSRLPRDIKTTNSYCSAEVHGLQWFEGDVSPRRMRRHLYAVARAARRTYVRGEEKVSYLENVIGRSIIDLENYNSPSFNKFESLFPNSSVCMTPTKTH